MKALLIISAILVFPFTLLSIAVGVILLTNPSFMGQNINSLIMLVYLLILLVSSFFIGTTTINMIQYIPKINKLNEAEKGLVKERERLWNIIKKYNDLISKEEQTRANNTLLEALKLAENELQKWHMSFTEDEDLPEILAMIREAIKITES